jgi:hypothetical protein
MAVNIPTELLRSFVAVIETGSILQATVRVFVTQSAISLQCAQAGGYHPATSVQPALVQAPSNSCRRTPVEHGAADFGAERSRNDLFGLVNLARHRSAHLAKKLP